MYSIIILVALEELMEDCLKLCFKTLYLYKGCLHSHFNTSK